MKKSLVCALAALALACGGGPKKPRLNIYNWTYYMPREVVDEFAKKHNADIVYDVYPSNEEMFTKLKSGARGYDIVVPSGDFVSIMIHETMLAPIDKSKIPNFANIDTSVLRRASYDPENRFSVPYMMGGSGIAVNKKYVKTYRRSWSMFGRNDLKDRMTMLDDMREVLGCALRDLGYSVNTADTAELARARALVLGWKRSIVKFDAESFAKGFAAGEFWVVHGYAENIFREYDSTKRGEVDFFIPDEGGPMYIDNMVILKDSRNKELAHAFINYIHEPDVYARIIDYLGYPCINSAAKPLVTKKSNYELEDLKKCEIKEDLGEKLELFNKVWQEIRVGK